MFFRKFGHLNLEIDSDFGIRISDLANDRSGGMNGVSMRDCWSSECREVNDI